MEEDKDGMSSEVPVRFLCCVTHTDDVIKGFFGKYRYLSNFHKCEISYKGRLFPSSEHAYMFAKLAYPTLEDYEHVISLTCRQVKKWGQTITLRDDWEKGFKFRAMHEILSYKFSDAHPNLRDLLLATGGAYLEETNNWGDVVWGRDIDKGGKNKLGQILMAIRSALQMQRLFWDEYMTTP
jgi:ribA/ribD-fused uncharacterized protein